MASGGDSLKRKFGKEGSVSPPPLRRKVPSTTTKSAVTSFFTPTSQKAPEKTIWQERAPNDDTAATLLVGRYKPDDHEASPDISNKRRKVAVFDFDSTLIQTNSGKKFSSDAQDWRWWHPTVPRILRKLYHEEGYEVKAFNIKTNQLSSLSYLVAIISNQAGIAMKPDRKLPKAQITRLASFKSKVTSVLNQLDLPISIYAATEKDIYRKPRPGMWKELQDDYDLSAPGCIDLDGSFFVGDAGGRLAEAGLAKDFSCSDRDFAGNVGIKFHTPEEYFLKQTSRAFRRMFEPLDYIQDDDTIVVTRHPLASRKNDKDVVLFCGSPGAGKSTTYWRYLKPLGYQRVNQDTLKTRDRCIKAADEYLSEGTSIVIDNTNADREVRGRWVELAHKHLVPIRCVLFLADVHMNPERRTTLPAQAFRGFVSRYQCPELSEGFQDIVELNFQFRGTQNEREIWSQYWT
ncbi:MAG: hypothetical protein M1818_006710 [Claussenomyces sp. TS43310]|nr:MAG: hypothetical protein M1818_006710 [Claussenomyces sp. TS43310]